MPGGILVAQFLILGQVLLLPLLHRRLADFLNAFFRPEGSLPLRIVERLALDECNELLGLHLAQSRKQRTEGDDLDFGVRKSLLHLIGPEAKNLSRTGGQQRRVVFDLDSLDNAAGFLDIGHGAADGGFQTLGLAMEAMLGIPQKVPGVPSSQPASNSSSASSSVISVPSLRIKVNS